MTLATQRQSALPIGLGIGLVVALLLAAVVWPLRPALPRAAQALDTFSLRLDDPRILRSADLAIVDSATPPGDDARWQPVQLPELWRAPERWQQGINGWYRFRIAGPAPAEPTSIYLWRFSMNAGVWFNGEFIGDGGSFDEPVARNWNRPLLFSVPKSLWRDGENVLMVRLRVYPGFGHMTPPALGPTALLKPDFEQRHFVQITLSEVATGMTLLALLTALVLWAIERSDPAHPYFIAFCLAWLVYATNTFVRELPVPARAWWWLVHSAVDLSYVALVLFYLRLHGQRRPRVERTLWAALLVTTSFYAFSSLPQLARWNPLLHGLMSLGTLWLLGWMLRRLIAQPTAEHFIYAAMLLVTLAGAIYDQLLNALLLPELWRQRFYVTHLVLPLVFVGFVAHLALRVVRGVQGVRAANESLEARVAAAGTQMAAAYDRERGLLAERSAGQERERIYRDLHDNLGARLLSLVYSARDERQAGLAREALAEMRGIIAASHVEGGALADLAAEWRLEAELRAEDTKLRVDWQVQGDAVLGARQRFQLECIVRELVSNALEHSGGDQLVVQWQVQDQRLQLNVSDNGHGLAAGRADGTGLQGVRARVADLGGTAMWTPVAPQGLRCRVDIPLSAP